MSKFQIIFRNLELDVETVYEVGEQQTRPIQPHSGDNGEKTEPEQASDQDQEKISTDETAQDQGDKDQSGDNQDQQVAADTRPGAGVPDPQKTENGQADS